MAQLFPHILLDPRILIAQRTVAGLPTQDRTFLGLICSVPPLSLSIGQLPADGRGTAVQTASDFSTRNTIIFPQGYHSPLFSAKMVVAHRTASFGDKLLLTLLFYQIAAFLWAFFFCCCTSYCNSPQRKSGSRPGPGGQRGAAPQGGFGGTPPEGTQRRAAPGRWSGFGPAQVQTCNVGSRPVPGGGSRLSLEKARTQRVAGGGPRPPLFLWPARWHSLVLALGATLFRWWG